MERKVDLKFFCKVSLKDNPGAFEMSKTAKVKVKTGDLYRLILQVQYQDSVQ